MLPALLDYHTNFHSYKMIALARQLSKVDTSLPPVPVSHLRGVFSGLERHYKQGSAALVMPFNQVSLTGDLQSSCSQLKS